MTALYPHTSTRALPRHLSPQIVQHIRARDEAEEGIPIHHRRGRTHLEHRNEVVDRHVLLHTEERRSHGVAHWLVETLRTAERKPQNVILGDYTDQLLADRHGQWRGACSAQTIVCRGEHIVRPDRDRGTLTVRAADQIAQVAVLLALDKTLILHPKIVE